VGAGVDDSIETKQQKLVRHYYEVLAGCLGRIHAVAFALKQRGDAEGAERRRAEKIAGDTLFSERIL
jgi:hypothetical protein